MASMVLANPNEAHWGDRKVYMRNPVTTSNKTTVPFPHFANNPNPNPNSIPNSNSRPAHIHDHSGNLHFRQWSPPPQLHSLSLRVAASPCRSASEPIESRRGAYVTFNLKVHSKTELQKLKKRLVWELEQVRALKTRLETLTAQTRPVYPNSKVPLTRPLSIQVRNLASSAADTKLTSLTPKSSEGKTPGKGTKRANPSSNGPGPKRQVVDASMKKVIASVMKRCGQILSKLMKLKSAWVFNHSMDVVGMGLYDYHRKIKKPMDLRTVKSNLDNHVYKSPIEFASDVRLTFDNAMAYNPKQQDVHIMALQLLTRFNDMFAPAFNKFDDEYVRVSGQNWRPMVEGVESVPKVVEKVPAMEERAVVPEEEKLAAMEGRKVAEKFPKPEKKGLNMRELTVEDKQKLAEELEELSGDRLGQILQMLKKRCARLVHDGNDIELDMELMDTETLWELDRFVKGCKKMGPKVKRLAPSENLNQQSPPAPVRESSPVSEPVDFGEQYKLVMEEDVDIGEETPAGNYPPVEIERDVDVTACPSGGSGRSSSSGSGSGSSSSSGSESGSSSGSDSDADSVDSPYVEGDRVRIN